MLKVGVAIWSIVGADQPVDSSPAAAALTART
jgi:hypothetical protein